jgi:hypothetical protein
MLIYNSYWKFLLKKNHLLYLGTLPFATKNKYTMEKTQPLQQMFLGKVVTHLQDTETRSMSITLY